MFVHGFDVPLVELPDLRAVVTSGVRAAASELGVPLVEVETNLHDFSDAMGSPWGTTYHGVALAAVAHLLAPAFGEVLVGGTHTYSDLFPWGSHPLSDRLLSSDRVRLVHDGGDTDRVQKTVAVAGFGGGPAPPAGVLGEPGRDLQLRSVHASASAPRSPCASPGASRRARPCPTRSTWTTCGRCPLGDVNTLACHAELMLHLRDLGTEPDLLAACEEDLRDHDPAHRPVGEPGLDLGPAPPGERP